MLFRKILSLLFLCITIGISTPVSAQFEGQISMDIFSTNNGKTETNTLNLFSTPNRIFIQGEDDVNLANTFNSGGLLIRNDKKDFIVMMENNDALQVTKAEIEGLFKMLFSWESEPNTTEKDRINFNYTGKEKKINGYATTELQIFDNDDKSVVSVWLTPEVDINWGMMAEPWQNLSGDVDRAVNGLTRQAIFQGKNFPMLVEITKKGKTETVMKVNSIKKSPIAKAMVEVPTGVNIIGVFEFMMKVSTAN